MTARDGGLLDDSKAPWDFVSAQTKTTRTETGAIADWRASGRTEAAGPSDRHCDGAERWLGR